MSRREDTLPPQCPRCGQTYTVDARFCDQCGAPLPQVCSACGAVNSTGARFCSSCGIPLGVRAAAATPSGDGTPSERTPRATDPVPPPSTVSPVVGRYPYTPAYLVEKILTTRSALEGERKLVTVLF